MKINEIAEKTGLSLSTISRYFTGSANLSRETSEKIFKALSEISENHEVPLKSRIKSRPVESNTVAVLLPDIKYVYFEAVFEEIMKQVENYDYNIVFLRVSDSEFKNLPLYFKKKDIKPRGIILLSDLPQDTALPLNCFDTVLVGATSQNLNIRTVHINDLTAAYTGMNYLLGINHREIIILSESPNSIDAGFQRIAGCRKAFDEVGLILKEEQIRYGIATYDEGYKLTLELIEAGEKFTAIFAFSDEMAMGAMAALHDKGVRVPEEISVLGFDGIPLSALIRPALTTISQPLAELVKTALDTLRKDSQFSLPQGMEFILPSNICIRKSCRTLL